MKRVAYWAAYAVILHWLVKLMHDDETAERWSRRLYGNREA